VDDIELEQGLSPCARTALAPLVRNAVGTNLPGILDIYNEVIRKASAVYTEQGATLEDRRAWLATRAAQGYPVLVAADAVGSSMLGYSTFGDLRLWPGYRHTVEHSVYVHADACGRGVGAALVKPLFGLAAASRKHVMVAGVDAANSASIRLHERLGFERAGTLREVGTKFGHWLDLLFMQRFLSVPGSTAVSAAMVER